MTIISAFTIVLLLILKENAAITLSPNASTQHEAHASSTTEEHGVTTRELRFKDDGSSFIRLLQDQHPARPSPAVRRITSRKSFPHSKDFSRSVPLQQSTVLPHENIVIGDKPPITIHLTASNPNSPTSNLMVASGLLNSETQMSPVQATQETRPQKTSTAPQIQVQMPKWSSQGTSAANSTMGREQLHTSNSYQARKGERSDAAFANRVSRSTGKFPDPMTDVQTTQEVVKPEEVLAAKVWMPTSTSHGTSAQQLHTSNTDQTSVDISQGETNEALTTTLSRSKENLQSPQTSTSNVQTTQMFMRTKTEEVLTAPQTKDAAFSKTGHAEIRTSNSYQTSKGETNDTPLSKRVPRSTQKLLNPQANASHVQTTQDVRTEKVSTAPQIQVQMTTWTSQGTSDAASTTGYSQTSVNANPGETSAAALATTGSRSIDTLHDPQTSQSHFQTTQEVIRIEAEKVLTAPQTKEQMPTWTSQGTSAASSNKGHSQLHTSNSTQTSVNTSQGKTNDAALATTVSRSTETFHNPQTSLSHFQTTQVISTKPKNESMAPQTKMTSQGTSEASSSTGHTQPHTSNSYQTGKGQTNGTAHATTVSTTNEVTKTSVTSSGLTTRLVSTINTEMVTTARKDIKTTRTTTTRGKLSTTIPNTPLVTQTRTGTNNENTGSVVAALIGSAFVLMFIAIACILVRKRQQKKKQLVNPDWAGPSPFLEGDAQPNLSGQGENGPFHQRDTKRISLYSFFPQRLSQRLSQVVQEDIQLNEVVENSTFGKNEQKVNPVAEQDQIQTDNEAATIEVSPESKTVKVTTVPETHENSQPKPENDAAPPPSLETNTAHPPAPAFEDVNLAQTKVVDKAAPPPTLENNPALQPAPAFEDVDLSQTKALDTPSAPPLA